MADDRDEGGAAFPEVRSEQSHVAMTPGWRVYSAGGMKLRDYFAAEAMAGMVEGNWTNEYYYDDMCRRAYLIADAMLKARKG